MIIQPILVGLSCIFLGAATSCTTNDSGLPILSKSLANKVSESITPTSSFLPEPASPKTLAKSKSLPKDKHGMPTYKNHKERTRYVRTTSYSHMENEPGAPGRMNAAGGILQYGSVRSAAADWSVYPLGTKFRVKGQSHIYVVDDYGSALVGTNTIDIFKPTLSAMRKWGTRKTEITVIQWGSYERSLALLKGRTKYHHCRKMYYGCKKKVASSVASN
ncbi:MAG: 3D domain-containing protein [Akkermansiaceae bacterium]